VASKKNDLRRQLGGEVFDFYYSLIYKARMNPRTDEAKFRRELDSYVGNNKDLKNLIFQMEQLIFREI